MIKLNHITKIYNEGSADEVHALTDVDLEISKGEMLAVMGVSGSGKSTLLHILGCLDKASSGEYYLGGENVSRFYSDTLSRIRNERIGFVLQEYGLIEQKTALENVMLPLAFSKSVSYKYMKQLADNAVKTVGISGLSQKRVAKLSGGQKQRVAIARAIVNNPAIILADEPTAALDRKTSDEIMGVLRNLNQKLGKTIVIVTHDKRIADMCRRTVYIVDGKITEVEV